jgi:hypothetical protein
MFHVEQWIRIPVLSLGVGKCFTWNTCLVWKARPIVAQPLTNSATRIH